MPLFPQRDRRSRSPRIIQTYVKSALSTHCARARVRRYCLKIHTLCPGTIETERDGRYSWNKRRVAVCYPGAHRDLLVALAGVLSSHEYRETRTTRSVNERCAHARRMDRERANERNRRDEKRRRKRRRRRRRMRGSAILENLSESSDNRYRSRIRLCSMWNNRRKRPLRIHERDSAWTLMHAGG